MIVMIDSKLECNKLLFDFSNYTKRFEMRWKGYENGLFSACLNSLDENSILDAFTVENGKISGELNNRLGIKNLEIRNCHDGGMIYFYTKIENLLIADSFFHEDTEITEITNVRVENTQLDDFEIVSNGASVEISNSKIQGIVDLQNFKSFSIRNSIWKNNRVHEDYSSTFNLGQDVSFDNVTTNAKIVFISIKSIKMNGLIVHNYGNGYFLYQMIRVSHFYLSNSSFVGNFVLNNYLLSLQIVESIQIENCTVSNNVGGFIMVTDATLIMGQVNIRISKSVFQSNEMLSDIALIDIVDQTREMYFITVDHCKFLENTGESTLHIDGGLAQISNSDFYFNIANEHGTAYLNCYVTISNSKFIANQAKLGGAIYIGPAGNIDASQTIDFTCDNNWATYAGGCIYSENLDFSKLKRMNGTNIAKYYGNDVATPIVSLDATFDEVDSNGNIEVYPGQAFQINFFPRDKFNQSTSYLLNQYLFINSEKGHFTISQNFLDGIHSIPVVLQIFPIDDYNPSLPPLVILISSKIEIKIPVNILPCPDSSFLKLSQNGHYCEQIPLAAILSSVILGIILITIILAALIVIARKLLKLRKQERAEKKMELLFKDKEFIFETEQAPLLLSNTINSSDSGESRSIIGNRQQYIIPISEINILKRIGEGGMGVVYHAKWNRTDVAIKQLKTDSNDEEFENEAILMSSLRHPCIVSCFGVSLTTNGKYMIVEYLENGSLEKAIYNSKMGRAILRFETKLKILTDVAKGLVYLHSIKPHRIIHRDLKPGNLLLDKNMNAKVGDFGLSKIVSNNSATMTANVGTLLYMVSLDNFTN
ncbi:predicted protein [Naegleria gruberi]|uniref:non-specific serine/threonine protein kinase n=1 Tax=Naegleria gruberi TaxID=5762 RepID=D2W2J4_NAEGR|nr:uncharacterized protein NAEGRDRAFT_75608 [Naegleria gruberi]EFC36725.1 predicted protein [Naegleria gruberi]|eukprot:XP_002669469.1 predicted protein [Naegleria gruberi strain NEG-M]